MTTDEVRRILPTPDDLLEADQGDMDLRHARDEAAVALVRLDDDRSSLGDSDVRARHADVRRQELRPQSGADDGQDARRLRDDRLSIRFREHACDPIRRHVDRGEYEMGRLLPGHLAEEFAQVRLDRADPLRGKTLVHFDLLRGEGFRLDEELGAVGSAHIEHVLDRLAAGCGEKDATPVRPDRLGPEMNVTVGRFPGPLARRMSPTTAIASPTSRTNLPAGSRTMCTIGRDAARRAASS